MLSPGPPLVAVVGATATGKSELAVELARALDGEVVNADAMQLYRGMDIGTAKLPVNRRGGVAHHLLDVLDVTQEASLAAYQRQAQAALDAVAARGRAGLLVGGSGLYVRAVLDRLEIPPTDPRLRSHLESELVEVGARALHGRLAAVDPAAAARILPSNGRRVVRALEVVELTGRPFSAALPAAAGAATAVRLGLRLDRAELDRRITARVDRMWAAGLVAETVALQAAGLCDGRTASRALGYAQVLRVLSGDYDEVRARQETIQATRRFARRQESWFGRDARIVWLPADASDLPSRARAAVHQAQRAGRAGGARAGVPR